MKAANLCSTTTLPYLNFVQVKGNSVVLSLFKKSQDNWSHLTVHEKKMKDSKLVV